MKEFFSHLGLTFIRKEADELIYNCPWCEGDKLSVNSRTGAWQCLRGCRQGYLPQLAKELTGMDWPDVFKLLERFGLKEDSKVMARRPAEPAAPKRIYLKRDDVKPLRLLDQLTFCNAKGVGLEALKAFTPFRHAKEPWVLLPAFDPTNINKACGWIRCGVDGQMVQIKYRDESGEICVKEEKYPVVKGSSPGLLGLNAVSQSKSDTIVYAEGWKDALAAISLGYTATANSQGAKTWRKSWLPVFKNKIVYIVFDQDKAGVLGAAKVAKEIDKVAKEVHVVQLPYKYKETNGHDLADYVAGVEG